jgi:hypothetical protein
VGQLREENFVSSKVLKEGFRKEEASELGLQNGENVGCRQ